MSCARTERHRSPTTATRSTPSTATRRRRSSATASTGGSSSRCIDGVKPHETRTYGRRAFLGVTAVGLSSLVWGRAAWDAFVSIAPPGLVSGWRIYTVASTMPRFDPATWRLTIDGLVGSPQSITYAQLRALPSAEQVSTFHCVTGWTVHDVHWRGVRFADLLAPAQPS